MTSNIQLLGRRVLLRRLSLSDFRSWSEVRTRNGERLTMWEPQRLDGSNPDTDRNAFALRCNARDRDWQYGVGYGFGLFVEGNFAGEINLNSVQRGPFQSASIGYWIDEKYGGMGYTPEGVVVLLKYSFEQLGLHRVEIAIVPRNHSSKRVVEKLGLRLEGVAERFLEINGVWEDHCRYAITAEQWQRDSSSYADEWL